MHVFFSTSVSSQLVGRAFFFFHLASRKVSHLPLTSLTVATVGLDVLTATRLKVACSLLMANMVEVRLVAWEAHGADLLVVDSGSKEGVQAISSAQQQRVPLLALARDGSSLATSAVVLPPTASVLDITNALNRLIGASPQDAAANAASPLLEQLRLDRPPRQPVMMTRGLLRIVVDSRRRTVHFLRRMPLQDLMDKANSSDWQSTAIDEQAWLRNYQTEVVESHGIESLWWRLAAERDCMLPDPGHEAIQLTAWPDLDPGIADPHWALLLACLLQRSWEAGELARATRLDTSMVHRLIYVARASGLAGVGNRPRLGSMLASRPVATTRSFFKVAKHFGLKLLGLQHG